MIRTDVDQLVAELEAATWDALTRFNLDEVQRVVSDSLDTASSWRISGRLVGDRAAVEEADDLQLTASKLAQLAFGKAKAASLVRSSSVRRSSTPTPFEVAPIRTTAI